MLLVGLLMLCSMGAPREHVPYQSIGNPGQLVDSEMQTAVGQLSWPFKRALWPANEGVWLTRSEVPPAVLEQAVQDIRAVLNDEYVPDDLQAHLQAVLLKGPGSAQPDTDTLVARYKIGDYEIQLQEDGAFLYIMIKANRPQSGGQPSDTYLRDMASRFLKVPQDRLGTMEMNLVATPVSGSRTLKHGHLWLQSRSAPIRKWWQHIVGWSDGTSVFFCVPEQRGIDRGPKAHPGIPKRFAVPSSAATAPMDPDLPHPEDLPSPPSQ